MLFCGNTFSDNLIEGFCFTYGPARKLERNNNLKDNKNHEKMIFEIGRSVDWSNRIECEGVISEGGIDGQSSGWLLSGHHFGKVKVKARKKGVMNAFSESIESMQ